MVKQNPQCVNDIMCNKKLKIGEVILYAEHIIPKYMLQKYVVISTSSLLT